MKKIYYNIQLLSSFLLTYKQYILLIFTTLYMSNYIVSPIYCAADHGNYQIEQHDNNTTNSNIGWILFLGVIVLILYMNHKGGSSPADTLIATTQPSSEILSSFSATAEQAPVTLDNASEVTFSNSYILELNQQFNQQKIEIAQLKQLLEDVQTTASESNASLASLSAEYDKLLLELDEFSEKADNAEMASQHISLFLNKIAKQFPETKNEIVRYLRINK